MPSKLLKEIEDRLHVLADVWMMTGGRASLRTQYLQVAAETIRVFAKQEMIGETMASEMAQVADEIDGRSRKPIEDHAELL